MRGREGWGWYEPMGVSSKNGPFKGQQWGLYRWTDVSGELMNDPVPGTMFGRCTNGAGVCGDWC